MSILSNIKEYRAWRKSALNPAPHVPSRTRINASWLPRWLRGDYTLRNSELLFAAVSRISNALSAMPIQLYKGSALIKNELNDLVSFEPNPNMTSCQFIKTLETCRCTSGNCYAIKQFDVNGKVEKLDVLDPARVTPVLERTSGELWYRISPEHGNELYVHNYYILHIPFLSTNGYQGVSPVSVLQKTLDYGDAIQKFSVAQVTDGVSAKIVLNAPANLGETQKKEMIKNFKETYSETSGNILLLESGVTATTLNLSPIDSKIFEVEKITRSKVAMVYNIPPHLLGDYSEPALRSQEHLMLQFLTLTMLPIVTAYEQELNRKLLTREQRKRGYHFKLNMKALLRADAATEADVNFKAIRSGYAIIDEVRAADNKPPLPGGIGKHALVSQDLSTVDFTVNVKPLLAAESKQPEKKPEEDPAKPDEDPDE